MSIGNFNQKNKTLLFLFVCPDIMPLFPLLPLICIKAWSTGVFLKFFAILMNRIGLFSVVLMSDLPLGDSLGRLIRSS